MSVPARHAARIAASGRARVRARDPARSLPCPVELIAPSQMARNPARAGGSSNLVSGQMNLSDGLPLPGVSYLRLRHEADDLMVTSVFGSRRRRASMIGVAGPSEWLSATGPDLIAVHAVN
jgi:hypothetical protein